ncbi:exodeoxyribonuclease I [Wenzhouxiangella sp. XN201]|uniref:exodeoxyribonuclease I n=1 Tax=Wenzhouxiangella sp. XN201 TaxID=2710755 RepID=UPI001969D12A|nr:exodeoxyribonuclease I [Wenzhouxiangella sp. XN201]
MNDETFLWHDFETFGADPRRDRPAQFAAIRTDSALQALGEPEVFYCRPSDDVLPQPVACLITGITPQLAREKGLPENEFAARIERLMSEPNTCVVGYNNFRFDDEVTRHLFWRNFIDPYRREYANGNSRFDLIDLLRLARATRPDGITWPDHEDGRPSFRLEDLAAANGMDVSNAHDALADVRATIAMARLLRDGQPRLWQWALSLRKRNQVDRLLEQGEPLLHASSRFPAHPGCGVAPVLPIARHPHIGSQWLVWNLAVDPEPFLSLTSEELADRYWIAARDLPEGLERVPVKLVRNNRCPMLSPMNVLESARADALGIDLERVREHARRLGDQPALAERLASMFARRGDSPAPDPELDLYGGFPPDSDRPVIERVRQLDGDALAEIGTPFSDERLNQLLFRYRARLWPHTLTAEERTEWDRFRQRRLVDDPELASIRIEAYRQQLQNLMQEQPDQAEILRQLAEWPAEIGMAS